MIMEKIYNGYMEESPGIDPITNHPTKINMCKSVKDQPEVMEKAINLGKAIGAKLEVD